SLFPCLTSFFLHTASTPAFYPLSLHDALPICGWADRARCRRHPALVSHRGDLVRRARPPAEGTRQRLARPRLHGRDPALDRPARSEEHTSELQSRGHLVCRLLLEKKKKSKKHQ